MTDLSKLNPIGWYGRFGDKVFKRNILTGVLTIEPYVDTEEEDGE